MGCQHASHPSSPPGPAWAHTGFTAPRCTQLGGVSASVPPASTALLPVAATAVPNGHPSGPALSQGLRTGEPQPEPPAQPPEGLRPKEGLPWAQGRAGGDRGPGAASGVQCPAHLFQEARETPCRGASVSELPPSPSTRPHDLWKSLPPLPAVRAQELGPRAQSKSTRDGEGAPGTPCRAGLNRVPPPKEKQADLREVVAVVKAAQSHPTLCDPWTVACQAPLSMESSRQE